MRVKKITKKGVSPIIATTMLIGFTVAVIAMVVVWSRGYIEERAAKEEALANTKLKCETVKFTVEEVCQTGSSLNVKVKNLANQQIDSWILRIKGSAGVQATEQGFVVKGLESKDLALSGESYDAAAVGVIETVEVIPAIKAGRNKYVPCSGQMLEARASPPGC
ncbi:MAG: hypothetical protein PHO02_06425 [Candidatus Nanoarchaeia archaeon]|nr:hypothetical protein [Candidatus Nanoarchaeia archaeon]